MEKRAILALVLSLIILIGYPFLFLDDQDKKESKPSGDVKKETPSETPPVQTAKPESRVISPPIPAIASGPEETITVETSQYILKLSTRGGIVTYWELKNFKDDQKKKNIVLFDLKNPETSLPPLSVSTQDAAFSQFLSNGVYHLGEGSGGIHRLDTSHPQESIVLSLYDPVLKRGLSKKLTFFDQSYAIDIEVTPYDFHQAYSISGGSNLGIQGWGEALVIGYVGPSTLVDGDVVKDAPDKLKGTAFHQQPIGWTSLRDKYFIGALIPKSSVEGVLVQKIKEKDFQVSLKFPQDRASSFTLYAGPKEYQHLRNLNVGLDRTIEFGWFLFGDWAAIRWIAKTLFHGLQFLYEYTHNYGISIILLTVFIKIAFIPLTHKSYKSMKDMQNLQPEVQKLQKKYKDDKQKLNRELVELYRTHRVNPLGGCLPMVLQVPVFIGLFNLLYNTIELRQAPFYLWVEDLSIKDPFYVLPVVMGVTMFMQQKMMPTTMDPRQAKIMLFLPILFTFFFLSFPAGLVLYWLVNNVLTIAQQYITIKYLTPDKNSKAAKK